MDSRDFLPRNDASNDEKRRFVERNSRINRQLSPSVIHLATSPVTRANCTLLSLSLPEQRDAKLRVGRREMMGQEGEEKERETVGAERPLTVVHGGGAFRNSTKLHGFNDSVFERRPFARFSPRRHTRGTKEIYKYTRGSGH